MDRSRVCVACGLCCSGVLFSWVPILPEERWRVEGRGLPVFRNKLGPALALPCASLNDAGCAVYADRPSVCAEYRCKLLKDCQEGRIEMEKAIAIVEETKSALAFAACRLDDGDRKGTIWERAEAKARRSGADPESYRRANAELARDLGRLKALCRLHFEKLEKARGP